MEGVSIDLTGLVKELPTAAALIFTIYFMGQRIDKLIEAQTKMSEKITEGFAYIRARLDAK